MPAAFPSAQNKVKISLEGKLNSQNSDSSRMVFVFVFILSIFQCQRQRVRVAGCLERNHFLDSCSCVLTFRPKVRQLYHSFNLLVSCRCSRACNVCFIATIKNESDKRTIGSNSVGQKQGGVCGAILKLCV